MKKIIYLFILTYSFVSILSQSSFAAVNNDIGKTQGYISLNNSIVKEVEPNIATVTFAVENTADSANKAVEANNLTSNEIINALKLISNEQTEIIKTSRFSVHPIYANTTSGKRVIKNYQAVNSITVQTKDITKVAKLIDTAIAKGANRTDNLVYSLENDKSVCKEQYPILIKEMKLMANNLAQAAGTSIDGLKQLNVSCNTENVSPNVRLYAKSNAAMGSVMDEASVSTPVESGKIKVRIYVNADFYVK